MIVLILLLAAGGLATLRPARVREGARTQRALGLGLSRAVSAGSGMREP